MGLMLYDALINWDMSSADKASGLIPGLAESWSVDENDKTKWTFKIRKGAKFHDGSEFDADAVLWNFDRLFDKDSPQYSARMASLVNFRIPSLVYDADTNTKGWKKIDSHTVEFTTKSPDSFFPYQICYILMSSPAQFEATGSDWNKFAQNPSGTGPWKLTQIVPRERAEFVPFTEHWDETRQPKLDKVDHASRFRIRMRVPPHCSPDRWTGSRRPRLMPSRGSKERGMVDFVQPLPARLVLAPEPGRGLALERYPGAQGGEPRNRSRRHPLAARRLCRQGERACVAGRSLVRLAQLRTPP